MTKLTPPETFSHYSNLFPDFIPLTPKTGLPDQDQDCPEANNYLMEEIKRYGLTAMSTEEKEGRLIHDIIPIEGKEESYSNEGSNYFPFHVEVPHYPMDKRPDYVILFCLRGTEGANTLLIEFEKLFDLLQTETRKQLHKLEFEFKIGESFKTEQRFFTEILHPNRHVTLDLAEMTGSTDEAREALNDIRKTIVLYKDILVTEVNLQKGDILIFNNKTCIHGRSDFINEIIYNGQHRWLKRAYLKRNR